MNALQEALSGLQMAEPLSHEGLTVHPLIRASLLAKDYLTLDEALKQKVARVTEVSDDGSVPQLLFRSLSDQAVFLLDGEELVGAKQNRILNITILAPAGEDTVIPVSCVEAGRWHHSGSDFSSAPRAQFSFSRAKRAAQVSESMACDSGARSDQGEVWADIDAKLCRMSSSSATSAVEEVFKDHEGTLGQYVENLPCVEGQVGAVFSIRGKIMGVEFFDRVDTCRQLMPKLIRSYAIDAIDPSYRPDGNASVNSPQDLLELLAGSSFSAHRAVGEGEDWRFDSTPNIAGGALFARERIVHLCAFVTAEAKRAGDGGGSFSRASVRRHFRNVA